MNSLWNWLCFFAGKPMICIVKSVTAEMQNCNENNRFFWTNYILDFNLEMQEIEINFCMPNVDERWTYFQCSFSSLPRGSMSQEELQSWTGGLEPLELAFIFSISQQLNPMQMLVCHILQFHKTGDRLCYSGMRVLGRWVSRGPWKPLP